MLQSFDRLELPYQGIDAVWHSPHGNDFEAVVVVEMDMLGGNNDVMQVVLHPGEFLHYIALMMIVHHHHRARDFTAFRPFALHQAVANQISNGFGSGRIPLGFELFIKSS